MQNAQDVFSRISDPDFDVPPDLLDNMNVASANLPPLKIKIGPAELDLQKTATQFYNDNASTIQSIGNTIKPHLRGPLTPAIIILLAIVISSLASFILSIIQLAVLAAAVVYFFPSALSAVFPSTSASATGRSTKTLPGSRMPMAALAGVLAASYAVSNIAAIVVLASSAYAFLNTQTKPASTNRKHDAPLEQHESAHAHYSIFRRTSRHRESY